MSPRSHGNGGSGTSDPRRPYRVAACSNSRCATSGPRASSSAQRFPSRAQTFAPTVARASPPSYGYRTAVSIYDGSVAGKPHSHGAPPPQLMSVLLHLCKEHPGQMGQQSVVPGGKKNLQYTPRVYTNPEGRSSQGTRVTYSQHRGSMLPNINHMVDPMIRMA